MRDAAISPEANRRGDDMAPMQGSNVSNQSFDQSGMNGTSKKKSKKQGTDN